MKNKIKTATLTVGGFPLTVKYTDHGIISVIDGKGKPLSPYLHKRIENMVFGSKPKVHSPGRSYRSKWD